MTEYTNFTREVAKIRRTSLGFEDHGILTAYLHVDFGGSGQGLGGYNLTGAACAKFVAGTLKALDVTDWKDLTGRYLYVLRDEQQRVVGIENLPTDKGERFLFADALG